MRIGQVDFELGHRGLAHQRIMNAVRERGPVDYEELRQIHVENGGEKELPFDRLLENLRPHIESKPIDATTFYRAKPWLSSEDVAQLAGVSLRTVQNWYDKGVLSGKKIAGRLRFDPEEVELFLSGHDTTEFYVADDPVLDELWDNEADAAYDNL